MECQYIKSNKENCKYKAIHEFFDTEIRVQKNYCTRHYNQYINKEKNKEQPDIIEKIDITNDIIIYKNITKNIIFKYQDISNTKNLLQYETTHGIVKHFFGFIHTLGGIVSINAGDFERINGYPNYWAWGYEDNMLKIRVVNANYDIDRNNFYKQRWKNVHTLDQASVFLLDYYECCKDITKLGVLLSDVWRPSSISRWGHIYEMYEGMGIQSVALLYSGQQITPIRWPWR